MDLVNALFAPIVVGGRVVGIIGLANKPEGFTEEDAQDVAKFTEFAAVGLSNYLTRKALEENEGRFRLLYQNAPVPYQSLNEIGRFAEVNRAWLDCMGYSRDEVIGKRFKDFLSARYHGHFQVSFSRLMAEGSIRNVEFELITKGRFHGSRIIGWKDRAGRTGTIHANPLHFPRYH